MRRPWAAAAACWLGIVAADATAPEQFEWRQAISVDARQGGATYRFELPKSVYAGSHRQDLGDLRFFNAVGQIVPHALLDYAQPVQVDAKQQPLPFFPLYRGKANGGGQFDISVRQTTDGALISTQLRSAVQPTAKVEGYLVDASTVKATRQALIVDWQPQAVGTILPVSVDASDDLQTWRQISAATRLVDLRSGDQRLRQNRIELAGNAGKYFRIQWPGAQEGIEVRSIAVETTATVAPASRVQWTSAGPVRAGSDPGEFLFESPGLPLESIRLRPPEQNTVVPVRIFHRRIQTEPWREAANTVVYRLLRADQEVRSPETRLCCSSDRYWRISFDQRGGGIGQGTPDVELGWVAQQGIFVARGDGPYLLAYGDAATLPAAFPVTTLVPGYRTEQFPTLPEATFATPLARSVADGTGRVTNTFEWRSAALWAVLIAGVAALATMVWRLARQLKSGAAAGRDS